MGRKERVVAVPADVRAFVAKERLTEPDRFHSNWRAVVTLAMYCGAMAIAWRVDAWWLWIPTWVLGAFLLLGPAVAIHEAMHGNLYKSMRTNNVAGILWGLPILIPYATYKPAHFDHHRFTHAPGETEPLARFNSLFEYVVGGPVVTAWFTLSLWIDTVKVLVGRPPAYVHTAKQRRLILINAAVLFVAFAVVITCFVLNWRATLFLWAIPWLMARTLIEVLVALPEHYECDFGPATAFRTTRTTQSNPVLRFFYWDSNYHVGHHLVAKIPSQKLHRLQPLIDERCEYRNDSYFRWHAGLIRRLARGELADQPPEYFSEIDLTTLDRSPTPDPLVDVGSD
jgi:fatty acid desaturase